MASAVPAGIPPLRGGHTAYPLPWPSVVSQGIRACASYPCRWWLFLLSASPVPALSQASCRALSRTLPLRPVARHSGIASPPPLPARPSCRASRHGWALSATNSLNDRGSFLTSQFLHVSPWPTANCKKLKSNVVSFFRFVFVFVCLIS